MTKIILEDLDPMIIETLKTRAEKHGNSLQAEIKTILQQVIQAEAEKIKSSEDGIIQQKSVLMLQQIENHARLNGKEINSFSNVATIINEPELLEIKNQLKELKQEMSLGELSIREAREEGRRY
ncbi:MAG: FitA-like ribbon-helix-helix domain-containing protein [Sphaerospermopsis kisseleviana]